jgi:cbb3-type cytochrome oxidase subunit 1
MSAIPGGLETDQQPPMTIPLRHFVLGFAFLLLGTAAGVFGSLGLLPGLGTLAHVHLLLAGWVCVTIMGAMTQFVPVWSGARLHSRRLAVVQLWLVAGGLLGFVTTLLVGSPGWLPLFGGLVVAGFWAFVYNIGRTLATARPLDVTERHFALALGFFVLLTVLGFLLAVDFTTPVFERVGISRGRVVMAHATLAVFGAVLTTVLGALYQLGTMFTQTKLHGVDVPLRRFEEVAYPSGVVLLAVGRLVGHQSVARVGGVLVVTGILAFSVILARRLYETRVDRTPMLSRYAAVPPAMVLWAVLTIPAWFADPLAREGLFGAPGLPHLLVLGVIGFVVVGTLYHVVPFIVWVHRYSDLLGFEPVPMIDDLYDPRIARVDFGATVLGTALIVLSEGLSLPTVVVATGGVIALLGFGLFVANMALVIRNHGPHGLGGIFVARWSSSGRFRTSRSQNPPSKGR